MAKTKERSPDTPQSPETPPAEPLPPGEVLVQQEAAEPEPRPVPLVSRGGADAPPPAPPVAEPDPAPRTVHQNERAPDGLKRFKVRCVNYGHEQPVRYVLAGSEAAAREHYLKATGIRAAVAHQGDGAEKPRLSVRELAD